MAPKTASAPVADANVDATPEQVATLTTRDALGVTGDVRVGGIVFNKRTGGLSFEALEGVVDDEGFNPTRALGNIGVSGDDYREFLALVAKPEQTVVAALFEFLSTKLAKALDAPPQVAPQQ